MFIYKRWLINLFIFREDEVDAKFEVMDRQIKQAEAKVQQRLQLAQKEKEKREFILAEVSCVERIRSSHVSEFKPYQIFSGNVVPYRNSP